MPRAWCKRPWCCPEPRCKPIYQLKDSDYHDIGTPQPGESWLCLGRMESPVTFSYDGVEHANDLNSCHYTAPKGVIRFQDSQDDWENMVVTYTRGLQRLESLTLEQGEQEKWTRKI